MTKNHASLELADYGGLVRRRWHLIVGVALAGLLLGIGAFVLVPRHYTATASVLVTPTGVQDPTPLAQGIAPADVNLDTEAQLVTSQLIARTVQEKLKGAAAEELTENVRVTVPPNSTVLEISYEGLTPRLAQRTANAFAHTYLQHRREEARATVRNRLSTLRARRQELSTRIERADNAMSALPAKAESRAGAQAQRRLLTEQISVVDSRISTLSTVTVGAGSVISNAGLPREPSAPGGRLFLSSGLMAGLLAGVLAASLRDRSDPRLRRAADVERLTGVSMLLKLPAGRHGHQVAQPRTPLAQAFHELGRRVTGVPGHGSQVLLVAGTCEGYGGSMVATNLAAALARDGSGVVLVSTDPPRSRVAGLLGTDGAAGLADILAGTATVADAEQHIRSLPRLRALTPGAGSETLGERLHTRTMERLIADLRHTASYIVLEAPPTSESADAQALADVADRALVVVEVPRSEREQVRDGVARLNRMGAHVLGAVTVSARSTSPPRPPTPPAGGHTNAGYREDGDQYRSPARAGAESGVTPEGRGTR